MRHTTSIAITLCTYRRPGMLKQCLKSINALDIPTGWHVFVVVVDNDNDASIKTLVHNANIRNDLKIHYSAESTQGIPYARNRSVDIAMDHHADWILFIDDDEMVPPQWLHAYQDGMTAFPADIYMGPVTIKYPASTPSWYPRKQKTNGRTGTLVNRVYTSNTAMSRDIVSEDGLNLRFDTALRFSGGSDTEFFKRALDRGMRAVAIEEAYVTEEFPAARVTLKWHLSRKLRSKANTAQLKVKTKGIGVAVLLYTTRSFFKVILLPILLMCALVTATLNRRSAMKLYIKGLEQVTDIIGYTRGLLNKLPQPYKNTDGY